MNILKPTTFTWEQIGLLKWGVLLIGIAIGAEWTDIFAPYVFVLILIGIVLCIPPSLAWIREH